MATDNGRTLVLLQRTRFCETAGEMVQKKFGAKVECVGFKSFKEGQDIMKGHPADSKALLVWGNWQSNHHSNILNIRKSVKYVLANHSDELHGGNEPDAENHNQFSRNEGVIVRVCYKIDQVRGPLFMTYDYEEGNGIAHVSVDLNLLKGFPALPKMSSGDQEIGPMLGFIQGLGKRYSIRRFDMGGFHDMGDIGSNEMRGVYTDYFERFVGAIVDQAGK